MLYFITLAYICHNHVLFPLEVIIYTTLYDNMLFYITKPLQAIQFISVTPLKSFARTLILRYNENMYKILRIICGVISALLVAACIFIFVYLGMLWGIICVVAAAAFFGLCVFFKNLQEKEERKLNPPSPVGDFITGRVDDNGDDEKELF